MAHCTKQKRNDVTLTLSNEEAQIVCAILGGIIGGGGGAEVFNVFDALDEALLEREFKADSFEMPKMRPHWGKSV